MLNACGHKPGEQVEHWHQGQHASTHSGACQCLGSKLCVLFALFITLCMSLCASACVRVTHVRSRSLFAHKPVCPMARLACLQLSCAYMCVCARVCAHVCMLSIFPSCWVSSWQQAVRHLHLGMGKCNVPGNQAAKQAHTPLRTLPGGCALSQRGPSPSLPRHYIKGKRLGEPEAGRG